MNPTTESLDDAPRIGLPVPGAAPPPPPPAPEPPPADAADLRPGATGLGRPPQTPAALAPLTDQDRAALQAEADRQAALDIAEAEELLASRPTLFGLPALIAHPLTAAALLVITCVLALFIFSQATSTLAHLATLPEWLRYPGWMALGLLCLAVLYAALRLAVFYFRLRRNQQISLRGLEELARRTRLRWLSRAKTLEAHQQIQTYVRTFPMEAARDLKALGRLGF